MAIPEAHHPVWADILKGYRSVEFDFIAAKMLTVRLRLALARDPSTLAKGCGELRALFVKNSDLASVQRDLQKLSA